MFISCGVRRTPYLQDWTSCFSGELGGALLATTRSPSISSDATEAFRDRASPETAL